MITIFCEYTIKIIYIEYIMQEELDRPEKKFMTKYRLLDIATKNKLKEFLIELRENIYEYNGLTIFYSDTRTFQTIFPLLQILSKNIQTLSIGGDCTSHPISWTPDDFIIPDDILFE